MHDQPARLFRVLSLALLLASAAAAQRERPGLPPSRDGALGAHLAGRAPLRRLPRLDRGALFEEDALRKKGEPLRYGAVRRVDIGAERDGLWEELPDGGRLWRQAVASPGARSLGLVFERFQLPVGAELYVYDPDGSELAGAYTHENHHPGGGFAVRPLPGDRLVLELHEPAGVDVPAELRLAAVVHDYRGVLDLLSKSGTGGTSSCEVDVLCPQGAGWEDQRDAVLRVLAGGFLCSGALLNNTAADGAQLFLSADHCGDLQNAVFCFNYQRPACGAGSASASETVQGSIELARSSIHDVQLVRISEPIPDAYGAFLAGWDRSGATPPRTVTIHHPQGLPKKISEDVDAPRRVGTQWRVLEWDVGVTEPGSSGAPLFSPEGHVIGQLCCGAAACGYPYDDYYGRFDAQWSVLAEHLDPAGTGSAQLDGMTLVGSAPDPLSITGVQPGVLPPLMPGTVQAVTVEGSGFGPSLAVLVDGVPLPSSSFTVQGADTVTLDMPQVLFLGPHVLTVFHQGEVVSALVDVAAATAPLLQVASGNTLPANQVLSSEGLELTVAGPIGQLQYVLFSTSDRPSTLPFVSLCLGNGFSELELAAVLVVGSSGWTKTSIPLPPVPLVLYLQGVTLEEGLPVPASNCQEVMVLPG